MTTWKNGPPTKPGLYVLDHGQTTNVRLAVVFLPPENNTPLGYVRAHLTLPPPPKLQPIKITIPPPKPQPFSLTTFLHQNPDANLTSLTETMAKRGIQELEIPPELENHPLVKAALTQIHGHDVSLLDLQKNQTPQTPQTPHKPQTPQTPQTPYKPGQLVEVHATNQNGEPQWFRAIYGHYRNNGTHFCRINTDWQLEVDNNNIRSGQKS